MLGASLYGPRDEMLQRQNNMGPVAQRLRSSPGLRSQASELEEEGMRSDAPSPLRVPRHGLEGGPRPGRALQGWQGARAEILQSLR